MHTDFIETQLKNLLDDRSDRSVLVLIRLANEGRVPTALRLLALDLVSVFDEANLNPIRLEEIEYVLGSRLADDNEDEVIVRRILSKFGCGRRKRPRVAESRSSREDDTQVIR